MNVIKKQLKSEQAGDRFDTAGARRALAIEICESCGESLHFGDGYITRITGQIWQRLCKHCEHGLRTMVGLSGEHSVSIKSDQS